MFTSPKFNNCYIKTLEFEGGKDDDPMDPGGRTAYGIIQEEYDRWRKKNGLPKQDVWKISETEKQTIYWENYWAPLKCEELPVGIDFVMYDFGVNSGNKRAIKYAQIALHLKADCILGPKTLEALKKVDPITFIDLLDNLRLSYLQKLGIWWRFGKGWARRVKEGREYAKKLVTSSKSTSLGLMGFPQPISEDYWKKYHFWSEEIPTTELVLVSNTSNNEKPELSQGRLIRQEGDWSFPVKASKKASKKK